MVDTVATCRPGCGVKAWKQGSKDAACWTIGATEALAYNSVKCAWISSRQSSDSIALCLFSSRFNKKENIFIHCFIVVNLSRKITHNCSV